MSFSSFFSSFLPTIYADAPEEDTTKGTEAKDDDSNDIKHQGDAENDEKEGEGAATEEEEEEPEDVRGL